MGEVVNLRMARKRKARAGREDTAARNRAAHGMSRAEKEANKAARDRAEKALDGHRREPGDTPEDGAK